MSEIEARNEAVNNPPIPTYEEVTSGRASSPSHFGPEEISDDAERQGLLATDKRAATAQPVRDEGHGYRPPTVESARSSIDIGLLSSDGSDEEDRGAQHDMERLEIMDFDSFSNADEPSNMRQALSKRISSLSNTLSSMNLAYPRFSFDFITSRIPGLPSQYRPKASIVARLIALFVVVSLVYLFFVTEIFPPPQRSHKYSEGSIRSWIQATVDEQRMRENLKHITSYDHIAGSEGGFYLARWVEDIFRSSGLDAVTTFQYPVYLNYPKENGRRVAIIDPPESHWVAQLEEENVYEDPKPQQKQSLVFHGHSRAGNVTGHLVYANYGAREDFQKLKDDGVDLRGSIVLVKYGGAQTDRALKVKAAGEAGAAGCLIYSDPKEDGFVQGKTWPDGRWRPSDSVQRGSVSLMSRVLGDVLTPGWASTKDAERISKEDNPGLVEIPSLPLAWRDAQKLLQSLLNHGHPVPTDWIGGVPEIKEWWTGDKDSPVVHLQNEQDENDKQIIYNVMGFIEGIETGYQKVIVGNHRDAWCFGSADPGSGTVIMLEVVRIFGQLVQQGWKPLRSIEFASWDGEEYNMIGSTEYVEEHIENLRKNAIAYVNVDVGVTGDAFWANGSPVLERSLLRVLGRVSDPEKNSTIKSLWEERSTELGGLGSGSDYVAFQDLAGCSSIDLGFSGNGYPYHSCYETFEWMDRFGDPGFTYHKVLAQILALLLLELADEHLLSFDMNSYASAVQLYLKELTEYVDNIVGPTEGGPGEDEIKFTSLRDAADLFDKKAFEFMAWEDHWIAAIYGSGKPEPSALRNKRIDHNTRMSNFETDLLDIPRHKNDKGSHGIPGREQYKHIIFGPQLWSGYDEAYFPAIRDALEVRNWTGAQIQIDKAAKILKAASEKLLD